ncbi:hypothetical protein JHS3_22060 [Jeongeupia sp. HS-3]|nr:RDD family protein [Jeongeupia sp. HS-3]BCL76470.1 hypothetical protein JHS3_22060 [Jeongeupia sp. HS-3]
MSWVYELFLLVPVLLLIQVVYQFGYQSLSGASVAVISTSPWLRMLNFTVLIGTSFAYFGLCWCRGGQTLAMKTWRLQLETSDGVRPSWRQLLIRFVAASLCYLPCVPLWVLAWHDRAWLSWAWLGTAWLVSPWLWAAWFDRRGQLLHDRLAGTRIVRTIPLRAKPSAPSR